MGLNNNKCYEWMCVTKYSPTNIFYHIHNIIYNILYISVSPSRIYINVDKTRCIYKYIYM